MYCSVLLGHRIEICSFLRFFNLTGITSIVTPTYVAEIASASVRGMLGSCFQLMVTIGVLYVGIVGAFLPWRLGFIQDLKLKSHSIYQGELQ